MDGAHHAASCQERSEQAHGIGQDDQHHVPDLQHAFLFLNHYGVQEGRSNQPWHQRRILDRIPSPEAAPAQLDISPFASQQNRCAEKEPGHHCPAPRCADPCITKLPAEHRRHGKGEGNGKSYQSQIHDRRMDRVQDVLQQRVQTLTVGRYKRHSRATRPNRDNLVEGIRDEQVHRREEQRRTHKNRCHVRHHRGVLAPVLNHDKRGVARQEPAPQQQRPFLATPDRADLEVKRQIAVRMPGDIVDRKIAYDEQINQA